MGTPTIEAAKAAVDAGPISLKTVIPTLWMVGIAVAGGVVSFYQKVQAGKARSFNVTEFIGEVVTSAVVGIVTFWLCRGFEVNEWLTAAAVAVTGHMGSRAIFLAEQYIEKKLGKE